MHEKRVNTLKKKNDFIKIATNNASKPFLAKNNFCKSNMFWRSRKIFFLNLFF